MPEEDEDLKQQQTTSQVVANADLIHLDQEDQDQ